MPNENVALPMDPATEEWKKIMRDHQRKCNLMKLGIALSVLGFPAFRIWPLFSPIVLAVLGLVSTVLLIKHQNAVCRCPFCGGSLEKKMLPRGKLGRFLVFRVTPGTKTVDACPWCSTSFRPRAAMTA